MRRSTCLTLLLLASPLTLAACGSDAGVYSPSEPAQFDLKMFNAEKLAAYPLGDRAYVMGHAIGVYLMGKTLPTYVAQKGYLYRPGHSSPHAAVGYAWEDVLVARSGGSNGSGGVLYDDVPQPPEEDPCAPDDDVDQDGICNDDDDDDGGDGGGGDGGGGGGDTGCTDDVGNCPDDGGGDGGDGGGDGGDGGGDGGDDPEDPIDPDCENFLDPAAVHARELALRVDASHLLGSDFDGDRREHYVARFQDGLADALKVEDFDENTRYSEVQAVKESVQDYGLCEHSPLVLDLDGDGVRLSSVEAGVRFDLLEHGTTIRTAWPTGRDALLVRDLGADGRIASGAELFGQSKLADGGRWSDGFAALAELDLPTHGGNADGRIDASDAQFGTLRLWIDGNHDGVTDAGELVSLASERVTGISLSYERSDARDAFGNGLRLVGAFERETELGTCERGTMIDVWFKLSR